MDGHASTLGAVVGRQVRAIREDAGASQDRLAAAMRATGVDWTRAAVASLETGRRGLTAEEFLLLPAALHRLTGGDWQLVDLVPPGEWVELAPGYNARGQAIHDALAGGHYLARGSAPIDQRLVRAVDAKRAAAPFGLAYDGYGWQQIADDAESEAARRAARQLETDPLTVTCAAHSLWDRGLTAERDARADARAPDGVTARSLQAFRNHATRELLAELRVAIDKANGGGR